ncbi:rhodanese-like domain-containing protein [Bacteroidota bacterium]
MNKLSTTEVIAAIKDRNKIFIDVRPVDAYNGWCLENESRGGHLPGAKSLPSHWSEYMDWIEIVRSKNISPGKGLIIYGYNEAEATKVAGTFQKAGFNVAGIYNQFLKEWAPVPDMPLDKLPRYKQLVYPAWVQSLASEEKPGNGNKFVICHAHYRNPDDYRMGHIPGAIALDTLELESPETWNRRSPKELEKTLLEKGITSDTTVVLYGRFSFPDNNDPFPGSSAGHLGAIRCAFIMMYAGVKDVRILNGGLLSWENAGYETISSESIPRPEKDFGAKIPSCPELAVDIPEAKKLLKSSDGELVSIRSWSEFIGEVSGYNYIEKTGRIPGAVFGNCGSDAYHMENYRNLDHTTREYHEIEEIWEEAGITPDKQLAFYCGTGWRGSEAFFNAWLMGWPRVSVFDGGWFEWSNDPKNPVETGLPSTP